MICMFNLLCFQYSADQQVLLSHFCLFLVWEILPGQSLIPPIKRSKTKKLVKIAQSNLRACK